LIIFFQLFVFIVTTLQISQRLFVNPLLIFFHPDQYPDTQAKSIHPSY